MSLRLALAERWVPAPLRRAGLDELTAAAAAAFGCPRPRYREIGYEERLSLFARFTAGQAATADGAGRGDAVQDELRRGAEAVGRRLRRRLGVRSRNEALRALELLYRQLGIDLQASADGRVEVRSCLFSGFYDARVCRIMSAMDEGVAAGLTGGCTLVFTARLTEGAPRCLALMTTDGTSPPAGEEPQPSAAATRPAP